MKKLEKSNAASDKEVLVRIRMTRYRKPYKIKRKKSIFKSRFFWLFFLALIVSGGLFYFLVFSPFFQIKEIRISGNEKIFSQDLKNFIEEKISQKILFFSTKSIFLVNLNKINNLLLKEFPQIARVNLKRKLPTELRVEIEERKPEAILSHNNEDLFFIDREGIIFEKTSQANDFLKIKNLIFQDELKLGKVGVERDILNQILEINFRLKKDLNISLREVDIPSEERLSAKTAEGWEIYFNLKGDIGWQLTKLNLVLKERVSPEKRKNLQYIDLRFEKVYIK